MQFMPQQVDELKQMSQTLGVNFQEKKEEFDPRRNAKNLMSGFLEGFTTIPTGVKPKTTYEAISHSMGHLAGFAPGILSRPLTLLGKGLGRTGLGKVGKALIRGGELAGALNKYSVPMFFGHKATGLMNKGLQKSGIEAAEFLKKGSAGRGILEEATTLATASAVSSIWKGPDMMWDSMVHGGIAGGMFGGLGNFTAIGNYLKSNKNIDHRKGEALLKGAIGAGLLGVPAYLRDDPIEMIMYETLLGGYFGYNGRPAKEVEGGKFVQNLKYEGESQRYIFRPESHPEWNRYSKGAQDYVLRNTKEYAYKYIIPKVMESSGMSEADVYNNYRKRASVRFDTENPTEKEINTLIREDANQHIEYSLKGYRMEWETSREGYNRDFEPEDATEYHNIDLDRKRTPLEELRDSNKETREVLIPEINVDQSSGKTYVVFKPANGYYDKGSRNVGESTYGSTPVEKFENATTYSKDGGANQKTTYISMEKIYVKDSKQFKDGDILHKFISPMDYVKKTGQKLFEPMVDSDIRRNISEGLSKTNQYIFGGVKDKGIWKIRDLHLDIDNHSTQVLMRELAKGRVSKNISETDAYNEINKSYKAGLSLELEWLGLKKPNQSIDSIKRTPGVMKAIDHYNKQWKSNVLVEAQTNGYYIEGSNNISKISGIVKDGHVKNVVDWNKRAQVRFDKSYALKADAKYKDRNTNTVEDYIFTKKLPNGDLVRRNSFNYEVLKDINKEQYFYSVKDKNPELAFYESWTDGIVAVHPKIYDQIQASVNLPKASMLKPVITVKMPDGGVLLVKSAAQRLSGGRNKDGKLRGSDASLLKFMENRNLDMIIFSSAAKHTGSRSPLDFSITEKGNYTADVRPNNETLSFPIDSFRVNLGTYVDPVKAVKAQTVVTQLSSNITESQYKGGNKIFYEDIMSEGPKAKLDKDGNSYDNVLDAYRKTGDVSLLKDLNIDNLSAKAIHDVFVKDNWATRTRENVYLAKELTRQLVRMDKSGKLEDNTMMSKEEWKTYLFNNNRILDKSNFDSVYRHVFPSTKEYFNKVYKKYMLKRYTRPDWDTAGKVWLNGQLPHNRIDPKQKVNAGEIKLDRGMGKMKVIITEKSGKFVEKTTLDKAWEKFEKMNASEKEAYKHNFEFVVVRVPMDSLSGARLLKFTGFTDSRGTSARTHARDDWYLGGADKDSDSAFVYQNFSERVKDIYRKHQNEWGDGSFENPMVEKKSKEMDKIFTKESESIDWKNEDFFSPYSQFNPSMRKRVAENAYVGTDIGMGLSAKAGRKALKLWDLLPENYTSADGNLVLTKKPGGLKQLSRMKMEMMNRSADAADYANSTNLGNYLDILLNTGWNAKIKNKKGEWKEATWDEVYRRLPEKSSVQLSDNMDYKVKDFNTGRQMDYDQWRQKTESLLNETDSNIPNDKNIDTLIARQMKQDGMFVDIAPLSAEVQRYIDIFNQFREMASKKENSNWGNYIPHTISRPEVRVKGYQQKILKINEKADKDIRDGGNANFINKKRDEAIARETRALQNNMIADLHEIATWKATTKSGKDIHKYLKEELDLDIKEIDTQSMLLDPISRYASAVKMRTENFDSTIPSKKEGKPQQNSYDSYNLGSRDINVNKPEILDQMIRDIRVEIALKVNEYKKRYPKTDEKKLYRMLEEYADLQLLGSFWAKRTPLESKSALKAYLKEQNLDPGLISNWTPWSLSFKNMYFQSGEIKQESIRKMVNAYSDTYKVATYKSIEELPNIKRQPWESPQDQTALVLSEPIKKVTESSNPIIEGPTYIKDQTMTIQEKAKALAINASDVKALQDFDANLKKVPNVAENFNDWFTQFTYHSGQVYRDVSTMTMKDIHAFNRWFKDIDRRFIQRGKGLPPYAWRVDPRYMNEQMALFEGKVFGSFETEVKTSDGFVKREIKDFTGSIGFLKEMFRMSNNQIDKYSALNFASTERVLRFRKQLNKEHAHGINELVIAKRNGEDITQNKWYEKLKNEIFIYDGKTRNMEQMVEIVDRNYTEIFKDFGSQWLWTKDLKGNRVDWNAIDKNNEYGVVNEYLRYKADGSLDINHFIRKISRPLNKGEDLPQLTLETLLRFQYEYKLEKIIAEKAKVGTKAIEYRQSFRKNAKTSFEAIREI